MTLQPAHSVIFDMDGVLVDTYPVHERAWAMLAESIGVPFSSELHEEGNGTPTVAYLLNVFRWADTLEEAQRLAIEKEKFYLQLIAKEGVSPIANVKAFLDKLQAMGIPCAVGTSAPRQNLEVILGAAGLLPYFQASATIDDVLEGKPSPDIFLKAAEYLQVAPAECIVFEDAILGIRAGKAAGMQVIALTTTHPRNELRAADLIVDTFDDLNPEQLFGSSRGFSRT